MDLKYPKINVLTKSRTLIETFGGYNHNLRIGDGEFYDMKNLTSDGFPVLSVRRPRGIYATPAAASGMIGKDVLCYVDGADLVMGGERVAMGLSVDGEPKTLVSMGAYVIIMPDKKYINTADITDRGDMEASVVTSGEVSFTLCRADGSAYENVTVQASEPKDPENMALWIDTSSTPHTLKQYSASSAMWVSIATTYIKITAAGIGKPFAVNDGVTISGIAGEALADLNATMILWDRGDDYLVVTGILDEVTKQTAAVTVSRRMPNMDFIIESGNRLWGCRYGTDISGNTVNEIYASKLGDFKNWNCFMGISTDSYAASVGTDGAFTGAITHLGYPLFFKENYLHKVYGSYPGNFAIQDTACRGVGKGSARSLVIVGEVLYYRSRAAVCAYDGSLPVEISAPLGDISYHDAVAGTVRNKYYISMKDDADIPHLFVYDTMRGLWHREDETAVKCFCTFHGELYYIDGKDGKLKTILGTGEAEKGSISWMAQTGIIGVISPDKKYLSRLDIRLTLDVSSVADIEVEYDSSGTWEHVFTMIGENLRSFSVPIRPRRCDHLRLRIHGQGTAMIYSICKTMEEGSEV